MALLCFSLTVTIGSVMVLRSKGRSFWLAGFVFALALIRFLVPFEFGRAYVIDCLHIYPGFMYLLWRELWPVSAWAWVGPGVDCRSGGQTPLAGADPVPAASDRPAVPGVVGGDAAFPPLPPRGGRCRLPQAHPGGDFLSGFHGHAGRFSKSGGFFCLQTCRSCPSSSSIIFCSMSCAITRSGICG